MESPAQDHKVGIVINKKAEVGLMSGQPVYTTEWDFPLLTGHTLFQNSPPSSGASVKSRVLHVLGKRSST